MEAKYFKLVDGALEEIETGTADSGKTNDGGKIVNKEDYGVELPSTGGPGTYIYSITGISIALLAGALFLLRLRQRDV